MGQGNNPAAHRAPHLILGSVAQPTCSDVWRIIWKVCMNYKKSCHLQMGRGQFGLQHRWQHYTVPSPRPGRGSAPVSSQTCGLPPFFCLVSLEKATGQRWRSSRKWNKMFTNEAPSPCSVSLLIQFGCYNLEAILTNSHSTPDVAAPSCFRGQNALGCCGRGTASSIAVSRGTISRGHISPGYFCALP